MQNKLCVDISAKNLLECYAKNKQGILWIEYYIEITLHTILCKEYYAWNTMQGILCMEYYS